MEKTHTIENNETNTELDNKKSLRLPPVSKTINKELSLERIFDAPKEFLFKMFTEAEHLKNWYGSNMTTILSCKVDFKVGGKISILLQFPNGFSSLLDGKFYEIIENQKLIFTMGGFKGPEGSSTVEFLNTVTFTGLGEKTKLSLLSQVVKAELKESEHAVQGMMDGWPQSLAKLASYLEQHFKNNSGSS